MLGFIAKTIGGLVTDVTVGVQKLSETIIEEFSSIPNSFIEGCSTGLITAADEEDTTVVEVADTKIQLHPKFGHGATA